MGSSHRPVLSTGAGRFDGGTPITIPKKRLVWKTTQKPPVLGWLTKVIYPTKLINKKLNWTPVDLEQRYEPIRDMISDCAQWTKAGISYSCITIQRTTIASARYSESAFSAKTFSKMQGSVPKITSWCLVVGPVVVWLPSLKWVPSGAMTYGGITQGKPNPRHGQVRGMGGGKRWLLIANGGWSFTNSWEYWCQ